MVETVGETEGETVGGTVGETEGETVGGTVEARVLLAWDTRRTPKLPCLHTRARCQTCLHLLRW